MTGFTNDATKSAVDAQKLYVPLLADNGITTRSASTLQPIRKAQSSVKSYASRANHRNANDTEHVKELDKLVD